MDTESSPLTPDLDAQIREQLVRWATPGATVGVLRDGARATRAYGVASLETSYSVRPDTLFPIGSISKVYTATLVMTLVDEGLLDLDTPVCAYLPDLRLADERARDAITLRQLLSHRSGIFGDYYEDFGMGNDALARCIASFPTLDQLAPPGELWLYCSSGFMLAGRVIEVVTGQPFETAIRERILKPLGLDHTFFFAHEAIAYPTATGHIIKASSGVEHEVTREYLFPRSVAPAGGAISTADDLLTFAAFSMGDGAWNGRRILSPAAIEAMRTPQTRAANFLAAGFTEWGGLGWAIRVLDGVKVIEHGGALNGFQVKLKVVPAERYAIAVLTNSDRGCVMGDRVAAWALDHVLGLRAPTPRLISLPAAALARCAGRYRAIDEEVVITAEGDGLRRIVTGADPITGGAQTFPPNRLRPISEREFVVVTQDENEGAVIDFIAGDNGAICFLRMDGRLYNRAPDAANEADA
jgi:CubicO group peptidase (beta-lactamase class C family)